MHTEPREQIDRRALMVWRITGMVKCLIALLIAFVAPFAITTITKFEVPLFVSIALIVIAALWGILLIVVIPTIRWRVWRYEVNERNIVLKHGVFVIRLTLIPTVRVQHVDTAQGPLMRYFGLASVVIYTAAGQEEIPALAIHEADLLRDRIAELAGVADDI